MIEHHHDGIYIPPQRIGFKKLESSATNRYMDIIRRALAAFGIDDYSIEHLTVHTNVTAKVVRPNLDPLSLRIRTGPAGSSTTEMAWLAAVRLGSGVATVEPFTGELSRNVTMVPSGPGGSEVECALFLWAEGEPLAAHLTPQNYWRLGSVSATLHTFASGWTPPSGMSPLHWDRTLYYEGTRLVTSDLAYASTLSRNEAATIAEVTRAADSELEQIAAQPDPIYLHGNIEMWNVLVGADGDLRLLDFEDVMIGQPIQDIAITLYYGAERQDYAALVSAFIDGYKSVRPWPSYDPSVLTLLMAARAIMLLNHALQTEPDPTGAVARLLPIIEAAS
ncbi:phosphotransferase enzyme family protein [Promicromonospora sp. NFX87]|uniref:phosphotransferase enzyme family protein n=1 Tax=Promicromonospora sp. NFX87 TaxID=3402691 RepID=UPI003AFA529F